MLFETNESRDVLRIRQQEGDPSIIRIFQAAGYVCVDEARDVRVNVGRGEVVVQLAADITYGDAEEFISLSCQPQPPHEVAVELPALVAAAGA